eukprot:TRINITY_DN24723_c0_g1_i1.p1 TRINITY_DN24723_c0_g1~~TRINITY_DN24723_c0_g1_i1.p1  ORF type:complete len:310 (+),score=84.97 TRINITY_DN24723_c0_g1_i1:196-1125(+)
MCIRDRPEEEPDANPSPHPSPHPSPGSPVGDGHKDASRLSAAAARTVGEVDRCTADFLDLDPVTREALVQLLMSSPEFADKLTQLSKETVELQQSLDVSAQLLADIRASDQGGLAVATAIEAEMAETRDRLEATRVRLLRAVSQDPSNPQDPPETGQQPGSIDSIHPPQGCNDDRAVEVEQEEEQLVEVVTPPPMRVRARNSPMALAEMQAKAQGRIIQSMRQERFTTTMVLALRAMNPDRSVWGCIYRWRLGWLHTRLAQQNAGLHAALAPAGDPSPSPNYPNPNGDQGEGEERSEFQRLMLDRMMNA